MRTESVLRTGLCLIVTLAACSPSASAAPPITWQTGDAGELADIQRVVAVAANDSGVVAVGFDEAGEASHGAIWFSSDGRHWARQRPSVDLFNVDLVDVGADDDGFLIIGQTGLGPDVVVLESGDGRAWSRRSSGIGEPAQPVEVAGGPNSALILSEAEHRLVHLSPARQESITAPWPAEATLTSVHTADPGWILGGYTSGPAGPEGFVAETTDGTSWTELEEPSDPGFGQVRWARRDGVDVFVLEGNGNGARLWSRQAGREWLSVDVNSRGAVLVEARGRQVVVDDQRLMIRCPNGGWAALMLGAAAGHVTVLDAIAVGDSVIAVGEVLFGAVGHGWFGWLVGAADQPGPKGSTSCVGS